MPTMRLFVRNYGRIAGFLLAFVGMLLGVSWLAFNWTGHVNPIRPVQLVAGGVVLVVVSGLCAAVVTMKNTKI